jgi:hypothetical protein
LNYSEKIKAADKILKVLMDEIMDILWNTNIHEFHNLRYLIPMFGEQSKYELMSLGLKYKDENDYLVRIDNILGVYHDYFPCLQISDGPDQES